MNVVFFLQTVVREGGRITTPASSRSPSRSPLSASSASGTGEKRVSSKLFELALKKQEEKKKVEDADVGREQKLKVRPFLLSTPQLGAS
jgi:hypothetical protein